MAQRSDGQLTVLCHPLALAGGQIGSPHQLVGHRQRLAGVAGVVGGHREFVLRAPAVHAAVEKERISLGIKQLDVDPFTSFTTLNDRGAIVNGKVKSVDPRGAEVQLNEDVTGYLRASEISRDRVEDARNVLKEGDEVSVMIVNVDRKMRSIQLSIKAKDQADQQEAMQRLSQTSERENAGTTSLGALLRAKLDNQKE